MTIRKFSLISPLALVFACSGNPTEVIADGTGTSDQTSFDTTPSTSTADTSGVSDTIGTVSNSATGSTGATDPTTGETTADTSAESSTRGSDSGSDSGGSESGGGIPCDDDTMCDDLLPCTGVETCEMGFCVGGTAIVCDDGVACTVDACNDLDGGACVFAPDDNVCSDGLFCTGAESCDPLLDCQPGDPIVCDDGVACTDDACDEVAGACAFAPDHASCQDNAYCNGAESCDMVQGCVDGDPVDCNDLIACTTDSCDEDADQCAYTTDDEVCDNGVFCDGSETCMIGAGCVDDVAVMCASDGVACTNESCNENLDACESIPDNNNCDLGEFCAGNGCIAGNPCSVDDGVLGNPACDDGLGCNGAEVCFDLPGPADQCQPGAAMNCADGFACTFDSCVEPGNCQHAPNDGVCNDGNPCDGVETCNANLGCVDGQPLDCDDNIACSLDFCIANFGCNNVPGDADCDDGTFCNGAEVCDLQLGCQAGDPIVCPSDGIACTAESCNEQTNQCVAVPNNDLCPCGETCDVQAGGCDDTCSPATCDGHVYECGNCLDDDNDCDIDDADSNCFGPCSDNEAGLAGLIPGQNNSPCKHDCYFDNNTGSGDDDCYWSHECDPLEPSATTCEYDPDANIPGTPDSCAELEQVQSDVCNMVCGELTPNGCDCFGCCTVDLPGIGLTEIFLGSAIDGDGDPTCSTEVFDDPNVLELCHECTQVVGCLNPCDPCELCFGQNELPQGCGEQECGDDGIPCGLPGQDPCPVGGFCLTGCCIQG